MLVLCKISTFAKNEKKTKNEAEIEDVRSRCMYISAVVLRCPVVDAVCHKHGWDVDEARERRHASKGRLELESAGWRLRPWQ